MSNSVKVIVLCGKSYTHCHMYFKIEMSLVKKWIAKFCNFTRKKLWFYRQFCEKKIWCNDKKSISYDRKYWYCEISILQKHSCHFRRKKMKFYDRKSFITNPIFLTQTFYTTDVQTQTGYVKFMIVQQKCSISKSQSCTKKERNSRAKVCFFFKVMKSFFFF